MSANDNSEASTPLERGYAAFHRVLGEFYQAVEGLGVETPSLQRGTFTVFTGERPQRLWGGEVLAWVFGNEAVAPLRLESRHELYLGVRQGEGDNRYNYPLYLVQEPEAVGLVELLDELERIRGTLLELPGVKGAPGALPPLWLHNVQGRLRAQLSKPFAKRHRDTLIEEIDVLLEVERAAQRRREARDPFDAESRRVQAKVEALERARERIDQAGIEQFLALKPRARLMLNVSTPNGVEETYVRASGMFVTGNSSVEVYKSKPRKRSDEVTDEVLAPLAYIEGLRVYDPEAWDEAVKALRSKGEDEGV